LIRLARKLPPRDRLLITLQLFTGFRIHEVLSITIAQIWRDGRVPPALGVRPGCLKGNSGSTRYVPIVPELRRAAEDYLKERLPGGLHGFDATKHPQVAREPLFVSRQQDVMTKAARSVCRCQGYRIIKDAFAKARIYDDGRLGTHSLRKSFAHYAARGIICVMPTAGLCRVSAFTRYASKVTNAA